MRTSIIGGLLLVVAGPVLLGLSAVLDLELEPVVLTGVALGAVAALVGDRSPGARLAGLLLGVLAAWVSFLVRAAVLPDSDGGRAVAVGVALALCVAVSVASVGRLPLWSVLLGAGGFAGAYEAAFAAAVPEAASTSLATATSYVVTLAVGFLVCAAVAPAQRREPQPEPTHRDRDHDLVMGENA